MDSNVDVQFTLTQLFCFSFLTWSNGEFERQGFFFDCGGRDGKVTGTHNGRDKQTREYINQNTRHTQETMRHTNK